MITPFIGDGLQRVGVVVCDKLCERGVTKDVVKAGVARSVAWAVRVTTVIEGVRKVYKAVGSAQGDKAFCVCRLGVMMTRAGGIEVTS